MSSVGGTLRRLRLESGISLRDLARRLGVSSAYLSRVEHGLDPVPTPERLEALANELGVPPAMLFEVGHRMSLMVERYMEQEPQAAALFRSVANRGLEADELADVQRYVQRRFRRSGSERDPGTHRLAPLLDPSRIVLGLRCDELDDAYEIGATRLSALERVPDAGELTDLFRARTEEVEPGLGEGIALVAASVTRARPAAALVVLATPIIPAGGGLPVAVIVLLVSPTRGRDALLRITHVARLGARGLAASLATVRHPDEALERIAALELLD